MPNFVRRLVMIAIGLVLSVWRGSSFDDAGGLTFENRYGSLTTLVFLAGIALVPFGLPPTKRKDS